jgi:hypothetical protein
MNFESKSDKLAYARYCVKVNRLVSPDVDEELYNMILWLKSLQTKVKASSNNSRQSKTKEN